MKRKICVAAILTIFVFCLPGCDISPDPTYIKNGFSHEMTGFLKERYGLSIPRSAIFLNGYYDNEYQDDAVHITFKVPTAIQNTIYSSGWQEYEGDNYNRNGIIRTVEFKSTKYTYLWYHASDGQYTEIELQGVYPGRTIT